MEATRAIPYKYRIPGFLVRQNRPLPQGNGPIATNDGYHDPDMVRSLLRACATRYPAITHLVEIGHSHGGRPLLALKISDRAGVEEDEPAVLFNGAHHGASC